MRNNADNALFRLTAVSATGGAVTPHAQTFAYDAIGNLTQRADIVQGVTESFTYDSLNRLLSASGPALATRAWDYDAIGNITYKSDVGVYAYGSRPHAVANVGNAGAPNSITAAYSYDANGSLTAASGTIYPASGSVAFSRSLTYTSFNLPGVLTHVQGGSTYSYTYTYSAEHERVRLVSARPDDTLTSVYLHPAGKGALLYEKETRQSNGLIQHKHFVTGGAGLVGVFVTKSSYGEGEAPEMRYYHKDHLGSIAVITNPAGAVIEALAYEAFGERRHASGAPEDRSAPLIGVTTDRGFTAHEHLDEMMLVHMNGRIYDPVLGRFMTADPFIQAPGNLQSYNRYSYGFNNPFGGTDPSGHFLELIVGAIIFGAMADMTGYHEIAMISFGIAAGAVGLQFGAFLEFGAIGKGIIGGFAAGFVGSGGDLEAGMIGAVSGAMFGAAGMVGAADSVGRYAAHALAGCLSSELGGGKCGPGAAAGLVGKFVTNNVPGEWSTEAKFVATTVGGGVASVVGGGKFANGAVTGAFGYLFNECGATRMCGSDHTRVEVTGNRVIPGFAHAEIQITGGYDYAIIEGQPNLESGKLEGRSNGANSGDAFRIELTPPPGHTTATFARELQVSAMLYRNDLPYSSPNILGLGYNSNSYVSGILQRSYGYVPGSVPSAASANGFRLPLWGNPIPLK